MQPQDIHIYYPVLKVKENSSRYFQGDHEPTTLDNI